MDEEMDEEIIKPQIIRDFEQLQKENEELQESVAELKDKNLRQLAEMDNIRKNALKQRQDYMKYKYEGIAGDLLEVLDNFDRCIKNIEDESSKEGIRIVLELKKGADVEKIKNILYKKRRCYFD